MEFSKITRVIKIIFTNFLILYVLLYILEIFLQFNSGSLFKKTKFYYQSKLENQSMEEVVLSFAPYKFLNKNKKIIPLSGIANKKTILCLDKNDKPIIYKSDKFGFNNDDYQKEINILVLGDSYVHGQCVNNKTNLIGQMNELGKKAIGLGIYGNGPLMEYATLIEYDQNFKYDTLVWVFTPDNDFYDLSLEKNEPILLSYFKDSKTQDLISKNSIRENEIFNYLNKRKERKLREFARLYHLDLAIIRGFIKNIDDDVISFEDRFQYLLSPENLDNVINVFNKTNNYLKKNDKKLLVVINSLNPDIMFPKNEETQTLKSLLVEDVQSLKNFFNENKIQYLDFNKKVEDGYNEQNINEIFNKIRSKWDHYTPRGYTILAKEILDSVN